MQSIFWLLGYTKEEKQEPKSSFPISNEDLLKGRALLKPRRVNVANELLQSQLLEKRAHLKPSSDRVLAPSKDPIPEFLTVRNNLKKHVN